MFYTESDLAYVLGLFGKEMWKNNYNFPYYKSDQQFKTDTYYSKQEFWESVTRWFSSVINH